MNSTDLLISVIIPAYNTAKYIGKCLESVINQSYTNLEIIVIDDGSTDNLHKIVEKYTTIDSRVKLIRQRNRGAAAARNRGLKEACGDYIFFVDSDDWLEPNTIELLVRRAIKDKADVVMPDRYIKVNLNGRKKEEILFVNYGQYKSVADFVVNIIIGQGRAWRVSSVLYKANIIREHEVKFPEGHTAEDVVFNLDFLAKAKKISFIKRSTLYVNKRSDSVTATYQSNFIDTYLLIDKKAKEFINKMKYDKLYGSVAVDSLLCRNIILLLGTELSIKNNKTLKNKVKQAYIILNIERVREAFAQSKFMYPYWNSKIKVYYVVLMRTLIKYNFRFVAILLAFLSTNCYILFKLLRAKCLPNYIAVGMDSVSNL